MNESKSMGEKEGRKTERESVRQSSERVQLCNIWQAEGSRNDDDHCTLLCGAPL